MGCDIHLHTEIMVNGKWLHYSHPDIDRDYELFSRMAGIRGDLIPIDIPRGIPGDASDTTKFCYDNDTEFLGIHSASWLAPREISILYQEFKESRKFGYLQGSGWTLREWEDTKGLDLIQNFRWIFWFDN